MFKKHYSFLFLFVLSLGNRSFSQDLIHGSLKCTFKPENNWTQFVIWIEDESGKYIETVFITNFIGRRGGGNRISNPNIDTQTGNRLSALPIWAQKRGVVDTTYGLDNLYPPAASQPSYPDDMDAVSGATPSQNVQTKIQRISPLLPGVYNIRLEVNRSYDFNPYHNYSFYRGQPSLVWNTTFHVRDFADSNTVSDYLGYGSVDGSTGEIHPLDETITTAADLLQDMGGYKFKIVFTPENTSVQNNFQQFHCDNSYAL
ncbi:hypothetical protein JW935_00560, partial [candidate division KSB1 bacterium]|nr:hypothetical protein [candidate division KSB1 bacterium]